jgi:hypothetical protein
MQFADPRSTSTAFLVLRHLYDGDIIEWPIADDHPLRGVFAGLEQQGYVARWDRVWPLQDRYRLTENGIRAIESVYRPAGADAFFEELRRQNLPPEQRRAYLASRQLDPMLWPVLHDPATHWSTYGTMPSRYQEYVWEDRMPVRRKRPRPAARPAARGGSGGKVVHHHHHHHRPEHDDRAHHLVDLDREAGDTGAIGPAASDYDVS